MNSSINQYEQAVFVNGKKLKGVVSVDGSYSHSVQPVNILGRGCVKTIEADIPRADFSISRNLSFKDSFDPNSASGLINLGNNYIRGSLNYGNKVFGFETGYVSSYTYSVSYGDVPKSNVSFKVFGDIGSGLYISDYDSSSFKKGEVGTLNATGNYLEPDGYPIYPADIILTCRNSSTNRIKDFSCSTSIDYNEIYAINSIIPVQVSPKFPLQVIVDFTLEVDDYQTKRLTDNLLTGSSDNFSINVYSSTPRDIPLYGFIVSNGILEKVELTQGNGSELLLMKRGQSNIKLFSFESNNTTKLISEEISSSADDVVSSKLTYSTYINNLVDNSVFNTDYIKNQSVTYGSVLEKYQKS